MRLTVELEGKPTVVDVADDLATVRVGERNYPVRVVARGPLRVELEIGGDTVVVAGWPEHNPSPPGPVDVNGERWRATVRVETGDSRAGGVPAAVPAPPPVPATRPGVELAGAMPILPPMPGRVVELKVRDGEAVVQGAVLLVLEAMKMRNEVTAPAAGVVRDIRVREGANVRARETMLVLVPKKG